MCNNNYNYNNDFFHLQNHYLSPSHKNYHHSFVICNFFSYYLFIFTSNIVFLFYCNLYFLFIFIFPSTTCNNFYINQCSFTIFFLILKFFCFKNSYYFPLFIITIQQILLLRINTWLYCRDILLFLYEIHWWISFLSHMITNKSTMHTHTHGHEYILPNLTKHHCLLVFFPHHFNPFVYNTHQIPFWIPN